ncbi:MAG: hypothetical protein ABS81_15625 [Pseudonocardia sp. SCN 72-86]|nr:MAG: hypothetical protein ABS81_15625 [Pseudonocardia sp. SCN 72-86]
MPTQSPRRAIIYARISRDREGAGLGVERQIAECRRLAESKGLTVVGERTDNDLSAYSGKPRPGYRALCDDVAAGRADIVLAWHTDRLHRSPAELEDWIKLADQNGTAVLTVQAGEIDLATPAGRMQARIVGAVARHESEQKGARIAAQKQQARESGRWLGGPRPFGYAEDGVTLVEAEADLIRRGAEALLAGATLRRVVRMFTESGLPTARGRGWTHRNVPVVLRRWRNAGYLEHEGRRGVRGTWAPILTEEQQREVIAILDGIRARHSAMSTGSRSRWLLAGIASCPCGSPLRVASSTARGAVYRCATYERGGTTGHVSRQVEPLDRFITEVILARLGRRDALEALLAADEPTVDRAALLAEQGAAQRRLDEIAAMLGDGDLTPEMARTASTRARERLEQATATLAAASRTSPLARLAAVPDMPAWWSAESTDVDEQRAVIRALFERITVHRGTPGRRAFDPDTVEITWR